MSKVKENKNKMLSWNEICDRADGKAHLSLELKAKDEARWQVGRLMVENGELDPENNEIPEESIEKYCERFCIRFNPSGNIAQFREYADPDCFTSEQDNPYPGCGGSTMKSLNTRINYLYRDASNYKQHNEVVVQGTFTEEQIRIIIGCLDCGEYFIPTQVGFPEKRFEELTEDDHCWFELNESGFEQTDAEPNIDMDQNDIIRKFLDAKNKWNVKKMRKE